MFAKKLNITTQSGVKVFESESSDIDERVVGRQTCRAELNDTEPEENRSINVSINKNRHERPPFAQHSFKPHQNHHSDFIQRDIKNRFELVFKKAS